MATHFLQSSGGTTIVPAWPAESTLSATASGMRYANFNIPISTDSATGATGAEVMIYLDYIGSGATPSTLTLNDSTSTSWKLYIKCFNNDSLTPGGTPMRVVRDNYYELIKVKPPATLNGHILDDSKAYIYKVKSLSNPSDYLYVKLKVGLSATPLNYVNTTNSTSNRATNLASTLSSFIVGGGVQKLKSGKKGGLQKTRAKKGPYKTTRKIRKYNLNV